jgi:ureidoglycolate lyase
MIARSGISIQVTPLTRGAFAPFGDVIEIDGSPHFTINQGFAERYHDLATLDLHKQSGRPILGIMRATPWPEPIRIAMLERHPLSSQAFFPLTNEPFLIVVAPAGARRQPQDMRAFVTNGRQGINYHRGVWHHPLLVLRQPADFLVLDRCDIAANCQQMEFTEIDIRLSPLPDGMPAPRQNC